MEKFLIYIRLAHTVKLFFFFAVFGLILLNKIKFPTFTGW